MIRSVQENHAKTNSNRLLILSDEASDYLQMVEKYHLPGLEAAATDDLEKALQICQSFNMVLGEPVRIRHLLPVMDNLQWVQSNYVGVGPLLKNPRRDYLLTHLGDLYRPVMNEYVFCYLLLHERKVFEKYKAQKERRWDSSISGSLVGKTIAILGVGAMGSRIAQTAKFLGMQTRGYTRTSNDCEFIDQYFHGKEIIELVTGTDYLVCTMPETSSTRHLIDKRVLESMPSHSLLINIGRGGIIDEPALVRALRENRIGGAVLDVFQEEPLPPTHPFWTTPNLLMTFHTAAPGPNYHADITAIFAENYKRFIAGLPLKGLVDFTLGY